MSLTTLRRHFWMVYVVAFTAFAWVVKAAVDDLRAPDEPALAPATVLQPLVSPPPPRRAAGLWLPDDPDLPEPPLPPTATVMPQPPVYAPARTELPIELMGTIVVHEASTRFATLLVNDTASLMVARGSVILGGAEVVAVRPRVVFLREGDNLTYAELWNGSPRPRVRHAVKAARAQPAAAGYAQVSKRGIRKVDRDNYLIDRPYLQETLRNPPPEAMRARLRPNYVGGQMRGVFIQGAGSLYRQLGIRSGDLLTAVKGRVINSPNKLMALYNELSSARSFELASNHRRPPRPTGSRTRRIRRLWSRKHCDFRAGFGAGNATEPLRT